MKNAITNSKKGILLVTMMFTLVSFANDASLFNIKNDSKKTALTLYNVKQGDLLTVKDITGLILYKETIQKTGTYDKGFDLTHLPDGNYIFELDKDFEITSIPFKIIEKVYKLTGLDQGAYKIVLRSEGKEFTKFIKS